MSSEVLAGWRTTSLGSIIDFINGYAFKPEDWRDAGTPIIRIQNLNGSDAFNYFDGNIPERYHVSAGDLLFCWSGSRGTSFGARKWTGPLGYLNQHIFRCEVSRDLDDGFAFFLLEGMTSTIEAEAHGGGGLVHIKKSEIVKFDTLLPPLDEQRRIAEVLRSVDEAIAASQAVSAATQGVFSQVRAKLMEAARARSEEVVVADAIAKNRGQKLKKLQTSDYLDDGAFPIIDQGAAFVCGFTDDETALWPYDLPVIVFGDHTRNLKFVEVPFVIGADGTQCITPAAGFDARYLYYALQSLDLRGEGYARHFKLLKEKTIPMPTLIEQREIAEQLCSLEADVAAADTATERLIEVKQALMSDLLSGRVRVPA